MASVLKISHRSVQRIVKNQLGMRSFKRKTVHFLSSKIMGKRLVRSKGLLKRHTVYGINNILLSDEKLFTVEEANNAQNDRIIATSSQAIPDELHYIGRVQKSQFVMVWAGISTNDPHTAPDLNPMDYSIWSILGTKACAKVHTNVEYLKVSLRREWVKIPQETLCAAVEPFPRRLKAVIEKRGGYIE
ncbi:hypothetical protein LOD99_1836 [Oopsacas minuta]|uniref:Uncharacterized protein n=1 Tax=Oopsacas minuta TaxID=111878 RepID=A0AAV7K489_9METZ|nr:hypothetical protein LOD99_1836 [Oopsacas minuta]